MSHQAVVAKNVFKLWEYWAGNVPVWNDGWWELKHFLIPEYKVSLHDEFSFLSLKEFDKKYNPTWHCIVGRNFGSYVTHETKHFIYFYLGQVAILLFKSGWDRA